MTGVYQKKMNANTLEKSFTKTPEGLYRLEIVEYAKDKLLAKIRSVDKVRIKLKTMEIAFDLINNDRNRLIRELAECELELEKYG